MIVEGIQQASQAAGITEQRWGPAVGEQVAQSAMLSVRQEQQREEDRPPREALLRDLRQIAGTINKSGAFLNTHIAFSVHEETGETVIEIVNSETGEIIRQIPPEEKLRLMTHLRKMLGVLVDKKA